MLDAAGKPARRSWRFHFGLRSLFVLVTMVSMWLAHSLAWIRERRAAIDNATVFALETNYWFQLSAPPTRVPAGLWLLGERGHAGIHVTFRDERELQRICRVFPEAMIWIAPIHCGLSSRKRELYHSPIPPHKWRLVPHAPEEYVFEIDNRQLENEREIQ